MRIKKLVGIDKFQFINLKPKQNKNNLCHKGMEREYLYHFISYGIFYVVMISQLSYLIIEETTE